MMALLLLISRLEIYYAVCVTVWANAGVSDNRASRQSVQLALSSIDRQRIDHSRRHPFGFLPLKGVKLPSYAVRQDRNGLNECYLGHFCYIAIACHNTFRSTASLDRCIRRPLSVRGRPPRSTRSVSNLVSIAPKVSSQHPIVVLQGLSSITTL